MNTNIFYDDEKYFSEALKRKSKNIATFSL